MRFKQEGKASVNHYHVVVFFLNNVIYTNYYINLYYNDITFNIYYIYIEL